MKPKEKSMIKIYKRNFIITATIAICGLAALMYLLAVDCEMNECNKMNPVKFYIAVFIVLAMTINILVFLFYSYKKFFVPINNFYKEFKSPM